MNIELFPSAAVALSVDSWQVHWYGVLYVVALGVVYCVAPRLQKFRQLQLTSDQWFTLCLMVMGGAVLGGRLGYIFLYEPRYYLAFPAQAMAVWHGGMSFHGGLLGGVLALWLVCRRWHISFWAIADVVIVPVAASLALGRIGNYLNGELFGPLTTLPWGAPLPGKVGLYHPTPLYAALKDLLISSACLWHLSRPRSVALPGATALLFIGLYSVLRFFIEYLRTPDGFVLTLGRIVLTEGQILSVTLVAVVLLIHRSRLSK